MNVIPQIDTYPRVVEFCQTTRGKATLVLAFAAALALNWAGPWLPLTIVGAAVTFFPNYRRAVLALGALYGLIFGREWLRTDLIRQIANAEGRRIEQTSLTLIAVITAVAVFTGVAAFVHYIRARRGSFSSRRPVLVLICFYFAMLTAAGTLPVHGVIRVLLWLIICVLAPYIWFFAYTVADAASKAPTRLPEQLGFIRPIWQARLLTSVPMGKGAAHLGKVEAKTAKELSIVQLKAIKLLIWVFVLRCLVSIFDLAVYGDVPPPLARIPVLHQLPNLGIPKLAAVFHQTAAGSPVSPLLGWAAAIANFVDVVLGLYCGGNLAIACCRMAGFRALRNTYRPFQSQTILDFWNRYYYYFKELLVDFFFFPCYTRYFKKYPRLRLFAATISAATLGNLLFHFGRDYTYVARVGFWRAVEGFETHAIYALVLGVAIGISQLRNGRCRGTKPLYRRVFASAIVILFYALVETFDPEDKTYPLSVHLTVLFNMVRFF